MKSIMCFIILFIGTLALMQNGEDMLLDPVDPILDDFADMPIPIIKPKKVLQYQCKKHQFDICRNTYKPACGWLNTSLVNCSVFPCAVTFYNPCYACKNSLIQFVSCGACPSTGTSPNNFLFAISISTQLPTC